MDIDLSEFFDTDENVIETTAEVISSQPLPSEISTTPKNEIEALKGRLFGWNENCRDLFVDLRMVDYCCTPEDSYIAFRDKNVYDRRLYFKVDPQNPRDPKVIHAERQFCKLLGIPHGFFMSNRPTLKMNIVKTWQSGLGEKDSKAHSILRIRESKDCSIIRAFIPVSKCCIPLYELIGIIVDLVTDPLTMEFAYGDDKDDLVFHGRFLFEKEFLIKDTPVCMGFSLVASELDASPFIIEVILHHKESKTSYVASYGGDPFFKSKCEGITASQIKDVFPQMITRVTAEAAEIKERVEKKILDTEMTYFSPEAECAIICRAKGMSSKIRRAVYHQVTECISEIKTSWDLARNVSLVAKDYDSLKRLNIERAVGNYLNLNFGKD